MRRAATKEKTMEEKAYPKSRLVTKVSRGSFMYTVKKKRGKPVHKPYDKPQSNQSQFEQTVA